MTQTGLEQDIVARIRAALERPTLTERQSEIVLMIARLVATATVRGPRVVAFAEPGAPRPGAPHPRLPDGAVRTFDRDGAPSP
jgi:hypothetical protein